MVSGAVLPHSHSFGIAITLSPISAPARSSFPGCGRRLEDNVMSIERALCIVILGAFAIYVVTALL